MPYCNVESHKNDPDWNYRVEACPYCQIDDLRNEIKRLESALQYYAQPETYYVDFKNTAGIPVVCVDNGNIARTALGKQYQLCNAISTTARV